MKYRVTNTDAYNIILWDEETRDKDRPGGMGGLITISTHKPHGFQINDYVELTLRWIGHKND